MSDRFTKTDLEKAKEATKRIRDKRAQKRMKNSRPEKKGSSITDIFKSYGKYDGKPIELKGGGMSEGQKKLAAKAPPPNKIDEKDFAVLRKEKAKGRGMGLQDESVKPGKVKPVKAALGLALGVLGAAGAKKLMKKKSTMNPGVTSSKMPINLVEEYKKAKGLQNGGVMKYKRGMGPGGLDLPVISSVKPAVHTTKKAQKTALMKEQFNKQKSRMGKKPYSSMAEMREAKGFKPGESASEFNKRRKALSVAKNVASKTRIGKIALGVGTLGVAAQQYLKSKMKKKDEPKKKMGGGMMQKPMGYSKGTMVKARGCKLGRTRPTKIT